MRPARATAGSVVPGIIDTLSAGFEQINRIVWVVTVPIVVNLIIWRAPLLSAAPVVDRLIALYNQAVAANPALAASSTDPKAVDQARQALDLLQKAAASFNVLGFLVVNPVSLPSFPVSSASSGIVQISPAGSLIGVILALELVGMLLGCIFYGVIGQMVRDGKSQPLRAIGRTPTYWFRVLGFIGLLIVATIVIGIPVGIVVGLVAAVAPAFGQNLLQAFIAVMQIGAIVALLYLFFLIDAIIISDVGPIRAAITSARVVSNNFWSAIGLIALIYVISLGTGIIWETLSTQPVGAIIAIVGDAYVSSGLAAASMLFYQSRVSRLTAANGVVGRAARV